MPAVSAEILRLLRNAPGKSPRSVVFAVLLATAGPASAASISFNSLSYDPGAPVTISPDGSTAVLTESEFLAGVFLSSLPGLGDPEVIIATPGATLSFRYHFDEPAGNDDVFSVALLDGTTGDSLGPAYEFSASSSADGTVSFALSALPGSTLGLQFGLVAELGDTAFTSSLTLSSLEITEVPLPATLPLMLTGLAWLAGRSGRRRRVRMT